MSVQSVVFDSNKWSIRAANKWLEEHKFKHNDIDVRGDQIRYRQFEPASSSSRSRTKKAATYRTFHTKKPGVDFILEYNGKPKPTKKKS